MTMMISPNPILYSSLGVGDTIVLFILALVVFGPKRLPEIGRQIGKLYGEFRRASNEFKFQIEDELRRSEEAEKQSKPAPVSAAPQILPPSTGEIIAQREPAPDRTEAPMVPIGESIEEPLTAEHDATRQQVSEEVNR